MAETLGQRLQRLRQAAGLSQIQLAQAAAVPVGSLRNWEQDRRMPGLDVAANLARSLGVGLDELAGNELGKEKPVPEPAPARPRGRPRKATSGEPAGQEQKEQPRKGRKRKER